MKIINGLLNGTLTICGLTFLGLVFILIHPLVCNYIAHFDLNVIVQLLVVTLIVVAGLIGARIKLIQPNLINSERPQGITPVSNSNDLTHPSSTCDATSTLCVNNILINVVKYCGYSLFVFILVIAIAIACKSAITNIILIASAVVTVITFVTLIFAFWIIKEMQPEDIKRDMRILELIKQEKKDSSNEELFNKFEALKAAISEVDSTIKKMEKTNNA